jgi:hypothetical protein
MEAVRKELPPYSSVPLEMKALHQWVLWKIENRDSKPTKVPFSVSGSRADVTNPITWSSFSEVIATFNQGHYDGIGFVFSEHDELCGIDLDKCVDKITGSIAPPSLDVISTFDSYSELSPSGEGVHIIVRARVPQGGNRKDKVEIYDRNRFFTVTGAKLLLSSDSIGERQSQLNTFHSNLFPREKEKVLQLKPSPVTSDDELLIARASRARNGAKFQTLYSGDFSNYASQSEAVLALLSLISFYTDDRLQIERIFKKSLLYSNDWVTKWERLGQKEIDKALASRSGRASFQSTIRHQDGLEAVESPERKKKDRATYSDYCSLLEQNFGIARRDIFSNRLMVLHEGQWRGVFEGQILGRLKSVARDNDYFNHSATEDHLQNFINEKEPELLVEIPEWDGLDRLHAIAQAVNVTNCSKAHFEEFLKEWGGRMFLRLKNPQEQNRCLILFGNQNIGKDFLIETLTGGLGSFAKNLLIRGNDDEKELSMSLSSGLVMRISEFDRTAKLDAATLKDIITKPYADFRAPYGRDIERRELRCSFIASCNTLDIFRDCTGNRRFMLFEIAGDRGEAIKFDYPSSKSDQLQILAQMKTLGEAGFTASKEAQEIMKRYIDFRTPEDPVELLLFDFDQLILDKSKTMLGRIKFTNLELENEFQQLSKLHGYPPKRIRSYLKDSGRAWKDNKSRGYQLLDKVTEVTDERKEVSPYVSPLFI